MVFSMRTPGKSLPCVGSILSQSLGFSLFEFEPFQPFLLFPFFPFLPFLPQALLGLSLGLGSLGGGLFLKPFLQSLLSLALLSLSLPLLFQFSFLLKFSHGTSLLLLEQAPPLLLRFFPETLQLFGFFS